MDEKNKYPKFNKMRTLLIIKRTILHLTLILEVLTVNYGCNPSIATLIAKGNTKKAIAQIEKGKDPNEYNAYSKKTPLKIAIVQNDVSLVKWLLENGADPNFHEPISSALQVKNLDIVKLLIEKGADINSTYTYKTYSRLLNYTSFEKFSVTGEAIEGTPLIEALCLNLNNNFIEFLIENGANINVKDSFGRTPLVFAVENNRTELVVYLVNLEANKSIRYKYISLTMQHPLFKDVAVEYSWKTIIDAAKSTGNPELIKLLSK